MKTYGLVWNGARGFSRGICGLGFLVILGPGAVKAAGTASGAAAKKPVPITHLLNREIRVVRARQLTKGGQSVAWAPVANRILLSLKGRDRYYRVHLYTPEGIPRACLTLGMTGVRLHRGNASWYPSGEYVVFTSQILGSGTYRMSLPANGLNSNIWLTDRDGESFWQLTFVSGSVTAPKGVVFPFFSPDGRILAWAGNTGKYDPDKYTWGQRAIYLGDFSFDDMGRPHLRHTRMLQPGERKDFYETHGFTPDGSRLLFSADIHKNQSVFGLDICEWDLKKHKLVMLTDTPRVWDRYAAISPDGRKIVWASNAGQPLQNPIFQTSDWKRFLRSEIWIMNSDGSDPRQLTHFNTKSAVEYAGKRTFVGEIAWAPDNRRLAAVVNRENQWGNIEPYTYIIELGKAIPKGTVQKRRRKKPAAPGGKPKRGRKKAAAGQRLPARPVLPLQW